EREYGFDDVHCCSPHCRLARRRLKPAWWRGICPSNRAVAITRMTILRSPGPRKRHMLAHARPLVANAQECAALRRSPSAFSRSLEQFEQLLRGLPTADGHGF